MRRTLLLSMLLSLFAFSLACAAEDAGGAKSVALPDWMNGHWCSEGGEERAEELWLPAAGGLMIGMGRTVAPARKTQFEFLRIELIDGVPTYLAQPEGVAATAFKRTDGGLDWIRFENPEHDFPQRVEYRRNGNSLHAEIAGPGQGGVESKIAFAFKRCRN